MGGGESGNEISVVGVIAVAANLVVLAISARPGIKVMYAFRAEEARLQAAIETTMAHTGSSLSSQSIIFEETAVRGQDQLKYPFLRGPVISHARVVPACLPTKTPPLPPIVLQRSTV